MPQYRITVMGAGGVGKTALVRQLVDGVFAGQYNPTIEDIHRHVIQLPDGLFYNIEILDTSGTHQFPAMRELSIKSSQAFILVFSLDDERSLEEAMLLGELISDLKGDAVPMVVVGNKIDIREEKQSMNYRARDLVHERLQCPYVETSARWNQHVNNVFTELLAKTYGIYEKMEELERRQATSSIRRLRKWLKKRPSIKRTSSVSSYSSNESDSITRDEGCTIL